jgi:hypothetical protein
LVCRLDIVAVGRQRLLYTDQVRDANKRDRVAIIQVSGHSFGEYRVTTVDDPRVPGREGLPEECLPEECLPTPVAKPQGDFHRNIAFTVREISRDIPIVANADLDESVHILEEGGYSVIAAKQ